MKYKMFGKYVYIKFAYFFVFSNCCWTDHFWGLIAKLKEFNSFCFEFIQVFWFCKFVDIDVSENKNCKLNNQKVYNLVYLLFIIMYFLQISKQWVKNIFSPDLAGIGTIGFCFIVTKLLVIILPTFELFDISFLVIEAMDGIFFFKPDWFSLLVFLLFCNNAFEFWYLLSTKIQFKKQLYINKKFIEQTRKDIINEKFNVIN